ncbi:cysteinyl leukotriene receptor 2 [Haliaeetus albicilla]|uniref:cysteinyl leukotriene receptor 2 n=1 Tax=Haliaeetus albicilla TaxID=8969 RepID=UPI0005229E10|nr:PREDICTED: cysteinyl leukotriene receptor 2 [Haliaeetus albicilla]XP_010581741.1 PREDICTED: cysteinyl leukotriene receptor 2 [Haliaeetus leucocephalus]
MNISEMAVDNNYTNSSFNCTIDSFKQVIYPTMYLFIFFLGAVGNSLSIYVFFQPSQRKTSVNIYMQNLAVSDLMFVSTLPFRATYFLLGSRWIFGDIVCRIMTYTLYVNMYCSIYFLTVLSVVRFIAIVYPFKHWKVTNMKYARITCAAIWVFVLAASSPLLSKGIAGYSNPAKCLDLHPSSTHRLLMMNSFVLIVGFILPFCTIIVCYVFAIKALLKSKSPQRKKAVCHKKALSTIIITLILFLLCFLPYHVLRTVHLMRGGCSPANLPVHKALVVTLCLAAMNSCLDPILYYFAAENFKARIRSLYRR